MGELRKVLIVEDATVLIEGYRILLADAPITVLAAETLEDAKKVFLSHVDIALIAVDGCFPEKEGESDIPPEGKPCAGEKLIGWLRGEPNGFAGPIIVHSSFEPFNQAMLDVDTTRHRTMISSKGRPLCHAIREVLELPPGKIADA